VALFTAAWGRARIVDSFCERDWQRFIELRRSGKLAPAGREGKAVRDRMLEYDLRLLLAVLNWATKQKDELGAFWLTANPLRGQRVPAEKNPHQPTLSRADYEALRKVAGGVSPRFELALVLCNETGHRLNSVRQLRWSDVDLEARTISWRAETDKSGKAHQTPLSATAVALLRGAALLAAPPTADGQIRDGWLFPSLTSTRALGRRTFYHWWKQAVEKAEITVPPKCAFHAFRRKLASELAREQLAVVKALGGWSAAHVVVNRYQKVSIDVQREVLESRGTG